MAIIGASGSPDCMWYAGAKMKVTFITNIIIPGRDAQSIQAQAMSRAFHEHSDIGSDFTLISPLTPENKRTSRDYSWKRVAISERLPRALRYLLLVVKSLSHVRKMAPDAIYSRDIGVVFFYSLLGYAAVYEMHKPFETRIGSLLFRYVARRGQVVAISQALKEFLMQTYGCDESQIQVAHDGVFLEEWDCVDVSAARAKLRREVGIGGSKRVVLYSSNLYQGKGLEVIVALAMKHSDKCFVVMGRKGDDDVTSLPSNMRYLGRKVPEEVPLYTKAADALIMPFTKKLKTWRYHSALKMFEYLASGVPILSSDLGSIREVLNDENAYLYDSESIEDASRKLDHMFSQPDIAANKASRALDDAKSYTWQKRADCILSFVRRRLWGTAVSSRRCRSPKAAHSAREAPSASDLTATCE